MTRLPCKTCPWRVSTKRGDYPGGGIDVDGLLRMTADGATTVMQCHNTPDGALAKSCVGFVLQVGDAHAGVRVHRYFSACRGESFETDEPLRGTAQLIKDHGVAVHR